MSNAHDQAGEFALRPTIRGTSFELDDEADGARAGARRFLGGAGR